MHLLHRNSCRACGSSALTKVIDLGNQYLQGSFVKPGKEMPPTRRIPLILLRCDPTRDENACGLLQLQHSVPPAILYSVYWYRSGTNQTMREHLRGIVTEVMPYVRNPSARVLDIGCNDGTLLDAYPSQFIRFGIDPSDVAQESTDRFTMVQDLFPSLQLRTLMGEAKFDIITSIAMFYDLEDPVAFVREISDCLAPGGIWVFEISYMPRMLEFNSYDTICHEHLEYYSFDVLERILQRGGMRVLRATCNEINGGSIRCVATHTGNLALAADPALQELRLREFDLELDTDKPYEAFQERIVHHRDHLRSLLKRLRQEGKRIHAYGASTKGNTILQWCGIDHTLIEFAADRNPEKHGARTLGTDIPIISEGESRAMSPDYYLVLPWHFKKEFLEREREMLQRGTGMIFPLPEIEIVAEHPEVRCATS